MSESWLIALCWALGDRPELRPRLADSGRVLRLVEDLRAGANLSGPTHRFGTGSTSTVNVHVAMRHCGDHHRFDRPLSLTEQVPIDEVVDATLRRLATASEPRVRALQRSWVEEVARVSYIDVDPWPFTVLVD